MGRISKCIAEDVADSLIKPLKQKKESLKIQIHELWVAETNKIIPRKILESVELYPEYFTKESCGYVYFLGHSKYVESYKGCNTIIQTTKNKMLKINDDVVANKFNSMFNELEQLNKEISVNYKEFVDTIMNLGTTVKLKEIFPEAYQLLPETKQDVVSIDITSTREKVKQIFNEIANG